MNDDPINDAGLALIQQHACEALHVDVQRATQGVRDAITVPLTRNQFSALVAFAFSVGVRAFRTSSVCRAVNARADAARVAQCLLRWVKVQGRPSHGLVRRRIEESELFRTPDEARDRQRTGSPM